MYSWQNIVAETKHSVLVSHDGGYDNICILGLVVKNEKNDRRLQAK